MTAAEALRLAQIAVGMLRIHRHENGALERGDLVMLAAERILYAPAPPGKPPGPFALRVARNTVLGALARERKKGFTRAPPQSDGRDFARLPIAEHMPREGIQRQMRPGLYAPDAIEALMGEELYATYAAAEGVNHGSEAQPPRSASPRPEKIYRPAVSGMQRPLALDKLNGLLDVQCTPRRVHPGEGSDLPALVRAQPKSRVGSREGVPSDTGREGNARSPERQATAGAPPE